MDRKKIVQELILLINRKYINSNKRKRELLILKKYVSNSDLFIGDKKKLYKKINSFTK